MKVVLINHKGGVGKTTLAVNIAFRYKDNKKQLYLIDFDKQHNAMQLLSGWEWNGDDIYKSPSVLASTGVFPEMYNTSVDVVFDCPLSFDSKGRPFAVRVRDFCDWVLNGCSSSFTFKNDGDSPIDPDKNTFIHTPNNRRREYGEI